MAILGTALLACTGPIETLPEGGVTATIRTTDRFIQAATPLNGRADCGTDGKLTLFLSGKISGQITLESGNVIIETLEIDDPEGRVSVGTAGFMNSFTYQPANTPHGSAQAAREGDGWDIVLQASVPVKYPERALRGPTDLVYRFGEANIRVSGQLPRRGPGGAPCA